MLLRNIRAGRLKRRLLDLGLSYQNRGFWSRKLAFLDLTARGVPPLTTQPNRPPIGCRKGRSCPIDPDPLTRQTESQKPLAELARTCQNISNTETQEF